MSKSLPTFNAENDEHQRQENSNSLKKDAVDNGLHSLITESVALHHSHQNSEYNTQSSVRYASIVPPPSTALVRRRRVIESIYEKKFEKIIDLLNRTEPPTMYELGLGFLHIYDGKFNYREGHTESINFRNTCYTLYEINSSFSHKIHNSFMLLWLITSVHRL
ncbi:unnamed protein product [Rotaria sp. Silwood2]|nr:unnamed protein product [Rotaria sp. Silwood2]CAF4308896.1 unnamed protein product [Rotaria sp. Silwood2]